MEQSELATENFISKQEMCLSKIVLSNSMWFFYFFCISLSLFLSLFVFCMVSIIIIIIIIIVIITILYSEKLQTKE